MEKSFPSNIDLLEVGRLEVKVQRVDKVVTGEVAVMGCNQSDQVVGGATADVLGEVSI